MTNPKLRFKDEAGQEFDDWEKKPLSEILSIKHGKDYKDQPDGDIPVLGTGGEITTIGTFLCDWPCALIGRKGTINKPQYMDVPFWSVDTLFYTKPAENNDPKFQFYLFQTINWMLYNEASGVPSLSASTIEKIEKDIPSYKEQKKISAFFSALDKKIALEEKKLQALNDLKKYFINNMMRGGVRFKINGEAEFSDWIKVNFFDVVHSLIDFRGRTPVKLGLSWFKGEGGILALSALNVKDYGIDYSTASHYGDEVLYRKWMGNVKLHKGQIVLTTEAPAGNVMQIPDSQKYILSQRVVALQVNEKLVDENFLAQALRSASVQSEIFRLSSGGTAVGISQKSLRNLYITIPSDILEQKKISSFIASFDERVKNQNKKLSVLKTLKRSFMQKMFS